MEIDGGSLSALENAIYNLQTTTDWTFSYCYLHTSGDDFIKARSSWARFTMEYSCFDNVRATSGMHADGIEYDSGTGSDWVIRYNWITNFDVTYLFGTHESGSKTNSRVYGNIFSSGFCSNGIIGALSGGGTISGLQLHQNTFYNLNGYTDPLGTLRGSGNLAYNNLFYTISNTTFDNATHDYNWFASAGSISETHVQNGSGNPFVNAGGGNFALTANTNAGMTLASPYNVDMFGTAFNNTGTWTRGAIAYGTGVSPPVGVPILTVR